MNKETAIMFLVAIIILSLGISAILGFQKLGKAHLKSSCALSKLQSLVNIGEDITQAEDSQQLCSNLNCTKHFQEKIDRKKKSLDVFQNEFDCDKLVERFT